MKDLLNAVRGEIAQYGYRKTRSSFWKIEDGFYKLIHFQHGAYGDYFFINVGLHPVGLPSLVPGRLEFLERPREHECVIRRRLEEIAPTEMFRKSLAPIHDPNTVQEIAASLPAVERWLDLWGSYDAIAGKDFSELSPMMPIAPILWRKAYDLLECYCMVKLGDLPRAGEFYQAYLSENREMDFSPVDHYMEALLR